MAETRKEAVIVTNALLLVVLVGLLLWQAWKINRAGRNPTVWDEDWWFAVYSAIAFGGNLAVFRGSLPRRLGRSSLATLFLAASWLETLFFLGRVLEIGPI